MQFNSEYTGSQLKAMEKNLLEKSQLGKTILPSISIDCVVFGFHDAALKVLVLKLKEKTLWDFLEALLTSEKI
jgi:hypothetical protein